MKKSTAAIVDLELEADDADADMDDDADASPKMEKESPDATKQALENFKKQFHKKTFRVLSDVNTFRPKSPFPGTDNWLVPFNRVQWKQQQVLTAHA